MRNAHDLAAVPAIVAGKRRYTSNGSRTTVANSRENDGGADLHLIAVQVHHSRRIVENRGGFVRPRAVAGIGCGESLGAMLSDHKAGSHRIGRLKELSH